MHWLFKLFSLLPLRVLQLIGAGIGGLTFKMSSTLRNRTRENLAQAGYTDEQLPERIGRNTGRQALESLWVWYRPAETVLKRVSVTPKAQKIIGEAMMGKRPIVFMTPHIGCFEVLPVWLASNYTSRLPTVFSRLPRHLPLSRYTAIGTHSRIAAVRNTPICTLLSDRNRSAV